MDAVLAVDDSGVELAALLAERLGLPGNPVHAVCRMRDKLAFRRLHFDIRPEYPAMVAPATERT